MFFLKIYIYIYIYTIYIRVCIYTYKYKYININIYIYIFINDFGRNNNLTIFLLMKKSGWIKNVCLRCIRCMKKCCTK